MKILVFAENPALTAELLYEIDAIGPFCSVAADRDCPGDRLADAAVVVSGSGDADRICALVGSEIPVLFLGRPPPGIENRGGRTATVPYPIDYRLLAGRLLQMFETVPQAATSPAQRGGHIPGSEPVAADKP